MFIDNRIHHIILNIENILLVYRLQFILILYINSYNFRFPLILAIKPHHQF